MPTDAPAFLALVLVRTFGLAAVAAAAIFLARLKSPAVRHAVWTLVTTAMPVVAAAIVLLPPIPVRVLHARPVPAATPVEVIVPAAHPAISVPAVPVPPPRPFPWTATYAGGVLFFGARLLYGSLLTRRLVRSCRPAGEGLFDSELVSVPLTVGWLRPKILLPADWRSWPSDKLQAVLVHERHHVARSDWAIAVFTGLNRCLFWFHPLAWWLERHLAALAEQACDDASLASIGSRETYAQVLVEMAAAVRATRGRVGWEAMAMAKTAEVRRRVDRILDDTRRIFPPLSRARWLALALCAIPAVYVAALARPARVRAQALPTPAPAAALALAAAPEPQPQTDPQAVPAPQARTPRPAPSNLLVWHTITEPNPALEELELHASLAQLQAEQTNAIENMVRLQQEMLQLEQQLKARNAESADTSSNLAAIELHIRDTQAQLEKALEMLKPSHPQVKRLQASLEMLQRQRESAMESADPQSQKAIKDLQASIAVLQSEIQSRELQVVDRRQQAQELERVLASLRRLAAAMPQQPEQASQGKYFVQGEVSRPGAYDLMRPTKVLQALVDAEGFRPEAKTAEIVIVREENGSTVRLPFNFDDVIHGRHSEQNVFLQPGDVIVVR
jgi:hypothetical protein